MKRVVDHIGARRDQGGDGAGIVNYTFDVCWSIERIAIQHHCAQTNRGYGNSRTAKKKKSALSALAAIRVRIAAKLGQD